MTGARARNKIMKKTVLSFATLGAVLVTLAGCAGNPQPTSSTTTTTEETTAVQPAATTTTQTTVQQ